MTLLVLIVALCFGATAVAAFLRPDHAFKRSAIVLVGALAFPYLIALTIGPFLGDGAGMGVAFILYAIAAVLVLTALAAVLGAAARRLWALLQG